MAVNRQFPERIVSPSDPSDLGIRFSYFLCPHIRERKKNVGNIVIVLKLKVCFSHSFSSFI